MAPEAATLATEVVAVVVVLLVAAAAAPDEAVDAPDTGLGYLSLAERPPELADTAASVAAMVVERTELLDAAFAPEPACGDGTEPIEPELAAEAEVPALTVLVVVVLVVVVDAAAAAPEAEAPLEAKDAEPLEFPEAAAATAELAVELAAFEVTVEPMRANLSGW